MFELLAQYSGQYKEIINIFSMLHKQFKNKISIVILVFEIFININLYKISLLSNKIYQAIVVMISAFYQNFFNLKKA